MGPLPLTSAARRFYAHRNTPAPHPERDLIRIRWPDMAASVLREANCGLHVSFKVFVNDNGAVSLTVIDTAVPAASYAPFLDALTLKLNQSFPVGDNHWLPFRLAPTDLQLAIHCLPIRAHPDNDADLANLLQTAIFNSQSILISKARFLKPDCQSRTHEKKVFSVVVQVSAEDGKAFSSLSKIPLLGDNRNIERAYSSSPTKQCLNCWRFGHVKPRCKNLTVTPLCAGPHSQAEHRCPNPTCPKDGNLRPVRNCCIASPACCPNCSEDHSAGYGDCSARLVPAPRDPQAAPGPVISFASAPQPAPSPFHAPTSAEDPDAMVTQPDNARPQWAATPEPPGLESPVEFTTHRAPVRPALMGPSGSAPRIGRPQPDEEPSPSPTSRDSSASRR